MLSRSRLAVAWCVVVFALLPVASLGADPLIANLRSVELSGNETRGNVGKTSALLGDRFEYWADDELAQFHGVIALPTGAAVGGGKLHVTLGLENAAKTLEEASVEAKTAKALFQLHVAKLPVGSYAVTLTLRDAQGAAVGEPATFRFARSNQKRPTLAWPADGLPLRLPEQTDVPDAVWPTHAPVPLPPALVRDVAELSLSEDGQPVPAQIVPVARWGPGDTAPLQWVHVHFLARYRQGKPARYLLHRRTAPSAPAALAVQETDKSITVDTGVLKFTVSKTAFAGISQAWADPSGQRRYDDSTLIVQGDEGGPYILDGRMIRFESRYGPDVRVQVEEAGPVRVVLRAQGWLGSQEKRVEPICLFNTRLIAYAGQSVVRLQHHTVLGYDTRLHRLADVGFSFASARGQRFAMGVDGKAVEGDMPARGSVFLHQDRHDRLRIVGAAKDPIAGQRSDGWFTLQGKTPADPGLTVLMRDVWQKFPKEVEVSAAGLTLHFWPAHGHRAFDFQEELSLPEIYKFWCFHQHRLLDLNLPPDYFQALQGYPGTMENVPQHALNGNGQGLAIGNDMLLQFGPPPSDPAGWARLHQENPSALAPPSWNADSGAMGPIAAADDPAHAQTEQAIENSYLSYTRSVERGKAYGMWNYADVHTYWDVKADHAELHRVWLNSHYHNVGKTWLLYFRGGSRDLLRWARASTDHYINVDTVNWASGGDKVELKFHLPGAMYHCKGQTHWGSEVYGMQRRDTHAGLWGHWVDPDASLWCWYLDANLRARDVYQLWHQSLRQYGMPMRGTRREINTSLAVACSLYEATWDPDLLPNIHGMGQSLRADEPLEDQNPGPMWHPLWMNRYFGLTRDGRYVPFILEHARKVGIKDTWVVGLAGLAYQISDDPAYLKIHFDRLLEMPRQFYRHDGDSYDWYGWGPGPLGSRWFWMGWPTYLKQLQRARLTVAPQGIPAGAYPYTSARYNYLNLPASLTVYALEEKDQAIDVLIAASSLGGDLHATSLQVLSPSGKPLLQEERINAGGSSVRLQRTLAADGEQGLYRLEFRGHEAHIAGPMSSLAIEGAVARADTEYRSQRLYSFLQPLPQAAPVTLTISSANDRSPCHAIVRDGKGRTIAEASLFRPRPQKQLVVELDPARHPLPWQVDVVGMSSLRFQGVANMLVAPRAEALAPLAKALANVAQP